MLLTSAAAARAFRVGVSSIKRWTDDGELESIRTPGGHRRYSASALLRFAVVRGLPTDRLPRLPAEIALPLPAEITLFRALATGDENAVRQLVRPPVDSVAKRAAFLDRVVGDALREIGYRWERAELTVDQEHRSSHMIAHALNELRPGTTNGGTRTAVLACPPGEQHDLPLYLVRLVLEWAGWRTEFLGASLPWNAARSALESAPAIFAFSSRNAEPYRTPEFADFMARCHARGVTLITGGGWARGGPAAAAGYLRFRTLRGFERWLRSDFFRRH